MDDPIPSKVVGFLLSLSVAAMVALSVGYVAHYDFGLSRLDIRTSALIGAAIIAPIVALLSVIEYFEKLRKSK
jgi:predicted membrane protein